MHLVDERPFLEADRAGQLRIGVPARARRRPVYPTGQQAACVRCAAAGVDRLGVSREGAGSDPLCQSCWRGRQDRAAAGERRRLVAVLRERLDVEVPEGCGACGSAHPVPECWLCGWLHLAAARAAQEAVDAAEAAREAERFALLAEVTEAEGRVDELAGWVARLRAAVDGYPAGSGRSRAVELLADLLARDAAARVTMRGRPGALARVAGVLAVDADWRSGRRAMPGRARSAELAGCTERAVTAAWSRATGLGWAVRTEAGRRLSLAERVETGRAQDRACYDLVPLHRGDVAARAGYVPAALAVLADLVEHAAALLAAAQEHLDGLRARAGGWVERPEAARRDELRAAVTASVERVRGTVRAFIDGDNLFSPHLVSQGEYLSSCSYRGLAFSPPIAPPTSGGRQSRRDKGASRSPARKGRADLGGGGSHSLRRPRPIEGACAPSRRRRARPGWAWWAYGAAEALPGQWAWTAKIPLPRRAAILGSRLGPAWNPGGDTAEQARAAAVRGVDDLATFVDHARPVPVLTDPDNPTGYLARILDEALTSGEQPPRPAALAEAHQREQENARRALVAAQAAAERARQDAARVDAAAQGSAARAERAGSGAARRAALAAAAAAARGDHATARAIATAEQEWPQVAQPGAGLPPGLER
ncbi:hypothetical protein ACGFI4_31225 [Micromonospora carbonacea]|uniref:hypothetical protein n=1 Tax=Micromonospora carbonacea TaxID=47853 RepID=UPI00371C9F29